ncbi:MAG: MFS transporter [Rhodospirillales bacterium]
MEVPLPRHGAVHYGWVIVLGGFLAVFAGLGLARFGLGMLLPSMGVGLDLTYSQMGLISTANFVGYLVAVVTAGLLVRRFGSRWTIAGGLAIAASTMIVISRADGFAEVLVLYVLTGIGSGTANVPAMALVSYWFTRTDRGKAAGFVSSGSGLGIIVMGAMMPAIGLGADAWRTGWFALGAIAVVVTLICGVLLRNRPEDLGLAPAGRPQPMDDAGATGAAAASGATATAPARPATRLVLLHLGALYSLFGASYVIYLTFFVTSLVQERGFSGAASGEMWAILGFLSLFSGPIFGTLSDRLGRRAGLMIVFSTQGLAYLLAAVPVGPAVLYLSVGLFGLVAWSIPSIMAAVVGDYFGAERAATAFGTITLFFGFGQIIGPAVAGWAAEMANGFAISFAIAAALAFLAVGLAALMPRPARRRSG